MAKTPTAKEPHFGDYLSQLLKEAKARKVTREMAAAAVGVDYRTIDDWKRMATPPSRGDGRIKAQKLIEYLENAVHGETGGADVIRDPNFRGATERIRFAEPLDFKKDALMAVGRSRHAIALIRGHVRASDLTLAELLRLLKLADIEAAEAQSNLMEGIEVNDKGENLT